MIIKTTYIILRILLFEAFHTFSTSSGLKLQSFGETTKSISNTCIIHEEKWMDTIVNNVIKTDGLKTYVW